MAQRIVGLSEQDRNLIQEFLRRSRSEPRNPSGRPHPGDDLNTAPDLYIAKVPVTGIAALSGVTPGSATCTVYRILFSGTTPRLEQVGLSQLVVNTQSIAVIAGTYPIIARDKFGTWLVTGAYLSASGETGTGTEVDDDERVKVSVNDTAAGYLLSKLVAGANIVLTEVNDGGNETLRISWDDGSSTGTGTDSCNVIPGVDFDDLPTKAAPDYLLSITGGCLTKTTDAPGTGVGCDPVTLEETDLRCEDGNLNLYRRVVTLYLSAVGCLVKTLGDWVYEATVACCDKSCAADGTGTGTGTGLTEDEVEKWWCLGRPDDTGAGTFGGNTGTGTSLDNADCYFLSTVSKNVLVAQGWVYHAGPFSLLANCQAACREDTGTGTGTLAGTGTSGGEAACSACPLGLPTTLQLTVVAGCPSAASPRTLTYQLTGIDGAGWYSVPETILGNTFYWTMVCLGPAVIVTERCGETAATSGSITPASCDPFDTGNKDLPASGACCEALVTIRVTE